MREFEYSFSAWLILVYQGLGFFVYASQLVYLPKLHEFIFGDANTTLIFGAEYIVSNLSAVICSIVADRFIGRFRVAFWSNQITILGFLLLNFVSECGLPLWIVYCGFYFGAFIVSGCGRDRTQLVTLKNELSKLFLFSWRNNETEVTINMLDYNEYPTVRTLFYVAPFYEHPGEMIFAFDSGTKALLGVTSHRVNELFSLESAYFGETIIEFHIGSGCQSERESCRKVGSKSLSGATGAVYAILTDSSAVHEDNWLLQLHPPNEGSILWQVPIYILHLHLHLYIDLHSCVKI